MLEGENCGTYGQELAEKHSMRELIFNVTDAVHALWPEDKEIAELFCW